MEKIELNFVLRLDSILGASWAKVVDIVLQPKAEKGRVMNTAENVSELGVGQPQDLCLEGAISLALLMSCLLIER